MIVVERIYLSKRLVVPVVNSPVPVELLDIQGKTMRHLIESLEYLHVVRIEDQFLLYTTSDTSTLGSLFAGGTLESVVLEREVRLVVSYQYSEMVYWILADLDNISTMKTEREVCKVFEVLRLSKILDFSLLSSLLPFCVERLHLPYE